MNKKQFKNIFQFDFIDKINVKLKANLDSLSAINCTVNDLINGQRLTEANYSRQPY